jgi:hypothetical protein
MSPRLENGPGSHAIWQRLLTHICVQTAQQGSMRLYARLPQDSDEAQLFKNVGFLVYGQEDVFRFNPDIQRIQVKSNLQLRPQHTNDGWGMQKLYATLTPRSVQNAEGLAQGQWEVTGRQWGEQGRRYGFIWEDDGEIMGVLQIRTGKQGYWIRTLLHPNAIEQASSLCRAGLKLTLAKHNLPVYFALRHYETGWRHVLTDLGFTPLTSQILLVKPMTVRIREKTPGLISALETGHTEGAATSIMTHPVTTDGLAKVTGICRQPVSENL